MNIAYDTETTGLHPYGKDVMFSYATCDEHGVTTVVRNEHRRSKASLQDLVNQTSGQGKDWLVMHNSKFDLQFTEKRLEKRVAEFANFHDTQIMSHILRNDHPTHKLKDLAWELAAVPMDDEIEVKKFARNAEDVDYSRVPREVMDRYQNWDVRRRTMPLFLFFFGRIKKNPKLLDCYNWERDAIIPTIRMEERGFMINRQKTEEIRDSLILDAECCLNEIEEVYGRRVNLGNPNVLRQIIYHEKKMPILARTKKTGLPSVEKEILEALFLQTKDPILKLAVRYGSRRRGSTMLQSYLDSSDESGVIHPSIRTLGAVTGRESCSDPNLQNVEKEGRLQNPFPTPARKCFRPRPGYVNFHVDYRAIELRLLIHYSKDEELVQELTKPDGGDPHYLAAQIFYQPFTQKEIETYADYCRENPTIVKGIDAYEVDSKPWKALRDPSKNTNFAVPYGAGWEKAALTLNLPLEIGKYRFSQYQNRFPNLCHLSRSVSEIVQDRKGVEDAFGGFLYVPKEKAYIGVNYLIQGTAAKILKRAQVRVHKYLEESTGGECGLIIPVHDELVIEWPRARLGEARACWKTIRELMIDFPQFDVPFEIEVSVSSVDWSTKKKFSLTDKELK